jgi:excinuclease ABC subunit A
MRQLRDLGNTVLVIEHDMEILRAADFVIDIGPGAGRNGGTVVAAGTPETVAASPESVTGGYLSGRLEFPPRWNVRSRDRPWSSTERARTT